MYARCSENLPSTYARCSENDVRLLFGEPAADARPLFGEAGIKLTRADVVSSGPADRLDDGFRLIGLDALGFEFTGDAKRIECRGCHG